MTIKSIEDVREVLKPLGKVVGLGVTAFPRTGIMGLAPDYELVCIKESDDVRTIRKAVPVKSVKKDFGGRVEKLNTLALLQHEGVQEYLGSFSGKASIFVYKSSPRIEKIVDDLGLKLLTNRSQVRDVYEDKWGFRTISEKQGFGLPSGEQLLIDDFSVELFNKFQERLGKRLVFQITDYSKGGGIGTFFVSDRDGFEEFKAFVGRRREAGRDLQRVNVTRFIEGESASITGCVTRHGILTSRVQRQTIDIPEVVGYKGRSGVFCGHDWGERYSEKSNKQAKTMTVNVGEYMYTRGYRGIFGVDLVVNRETDEVRMIEINSRYTGAFPVYSMLQKQNGEIPVDAWHLLEFSGVEYEMDFDEVQKSYDQVKKGAHLILHNLERAWVAVRGEVKAGVYKFSDKSVEWLRPGFSYADLKSDDELVLTDGVPWRNIRLKPGARIGRLIFKREVLDEERNELQEDVRDAVVELYSRYKLVRVKRDN